MDEKQKDILKAAWAMFARYGYGKTTMSDIATEAGVARQTVYNAFPGKEEILRAVVRLAGEISLQEVQSEWETCQTVEAKIAAFQDLGPASWYKAMSVSPDWAELMDGVNHAAKHEMAELENTWINTIEAMLIAHVPSFSGNPGSARDIAEFVFSSSKNAKYGVENIEHLERRLSVIKNAALALVPAE